MMGSGDDYFGRDVGISGTTAIVGRDDDNGSDSGAAYLFDTTTGQQIAKLLPDDGAPGDRFGWSVAISGTIAIIGARYDDDNGFWSGSAYLFDTTTGQQIFKLLPEDGAARDYFGSPVSISGTTAIVSAASDDNDVDSGSAYVFDTTTGQQIAKILPDDGAAQDNFGACAISGTTAIVGAYRDDDNGSQSGSAYLFDVSILTCPVHFEYPSGRPILVNSGGGTTMRVVAVNGGGEPQPGTRVLHVDRGNGFEAFPMNAVSDNVYDAVFPSNDCGSFLSYYVSAESISGEQFTDPPDAPASSYSVLGALDQGGAFADDFETDLGWTVTGDATDGHWERGVPAGDGSRDDPLTDGEGSGSCYLTGVADRSDVDNGSTVLTSPILDATGSGAVDAVIAYYRWAYSIGSGSEDIFVVEISNNGGSSWIELETVGPRDYYAWYFQTLRVSDFIQPTDQMRVRFIASDTDPQSTVEAGVDGVELRLINCNGSDVVTADSVLVTRGNLFSGGVVELAESDDQYLVLDPEFLTFRYQLEFTVDATSPSPAPSAIDFSYESKAFSFVGTVDQKMELFNYDTSQFETVDSRLATPTDSVVSVTPGGDPARFVQAGTNAMQARISYQNSLPFWVYSTQNLYLPYRVRADHIFWTITP